jgi:proline iminopeptidase
VTVAPHVQLFVHEEGRGAPVIAVHGGPGLDSNYLTPDLQPLARQHRVIYYDQRGSGRSTLSERVNVQTLVSDLDALRQRLGLSKVALLGHSWGGGLAALYAAAHPGAVSRLVLVSSMPLRAAGLEVFERNLRNRLTGDENERLNRVMDARVRATTESQDIETCREYWAILLKAYYADPASVARSRAQPCGGSGIALANGLRVNASVFASLGNFDWTETMSRLRIPTLVIHGDEDPVPVESAVEWARTLPDARLLVLARSGHAPYVEQPDQFFRAVDQFLAGKWPAGAQ